jgi:hypothetical protein
VSKVRKYELVVYRGVSKQGKRLEYLDVTDDVRLRELLEGMAEKHHRAASRLNLVEWRLDVHSTGMFGTRVARVSVDKAGRLRVKR